MEAIENNEVITGENATERNVTWETNHNLIVEAISAFMKQHERMPGKIELAERTGLTRLTIHKHLQDYAACPAVQEQKEQFGIMTSNVLASLYKYAVCGDAKAARLYLETMAKLNGNEDK